MSTIAATNLKNASSGSNNIVLGTDGSSTLTTAKVTTLADSAGANTSTPAEIASGRAKAWVNFNGTGTVAIRATYNVSSITDNGVGDYTVNFTTAFADANYCVQYTAAQIPQIDGQTRLATGSVRVLSLSRQDSYTLFDNDSNHVAIFR